MAARDERRPRRRRGGAAALRDGRREVPALFGGSNGQRREQTREGCGSGAVDPARD
jgi:hypothetical protein